MGSQIIDDLMKMYLRREEEMNSPAEVKRIGLSARNISGMRDGLAIGIREKNRQTSVAKPILKRWAL